MSWIVRLLLLAVVLSAAVLGLLFFLRARLFAAPQLAGRIDGMDVIAPVTVIRDRNGVPHIYAQSFRDALFALGFVHSQDRRLQMELMRRYLSGSIAEVSGAAGLRSDKLLRTLQLARRAEQDATGLSPEDRRLLEAYASGINAATAQSGWSRSLIARLLNVSSGEWAVKDTLLLDRLDAISSTQLQEKVLAGALHARVSRDWFRWLVPDVSSGIAERTIGESPVRFPEWFPPPNPMAGSNAWVVRGERSAAGFPILASDPHMPLSAPSGIYAAHLVSPEAEVIGVGIPGLPAFFHGHNGRVAWGVTVAGTDAQDLVLEQIRNGPEPMVRVGDEWRPLTVRKEEIRVRYKSAPEIFEVRASSHGPLISDADADLLHSIVGDLTPPSGHSFALALSAAPLSANSSTWYFLLAKARDWAEFRRAIAGYSGSGFNFLYADRDGHIGQQLAGRIPRRTAPPPVTPERGWEIPEAAPPAIPFDDLPTTFDPPEQAIISANSRITGGKRDQLSRWWGDLPWRENRIRELLSSVAKATPVKMTEIQLDILQHSMAEVVSWIRSVPSDDPEIRDFQRTFDGWDLRASTSSVQQTLAEAFRIELLTTVFTERVPPELLSAYLNYPRFSSAALEKVMNDTQASFFGSIPEAARGKRSKVITDSINRARRRLQAKFGGRKDSWTWGQVHQTWFGSALSPGKDLWNLIMGRYVHVGPFPSSGSITTVNVSYWSPAQPFTSFYGVGYRQVIELSDFSKSLYMPPPPGQSEIPSSRHYKDITGAWESASYATMLWTRQQVDSDASATLTLLPR